jgi:hypothetical protein
LRHCFLKAPLAQMPKSYRWARSSRRVEGPSVSALLHAMGGSDQEKCFHRYHRALKRAASWSSREVLAACSLEVTSQDETGSGCFSGEQPATHKRHPTFFSDADWRWCARSCGLKRLNLGVAWAQSDTLKVPRASLQRLTDALCYAAWMAKVELQALG